MRRASREGHVAFEVDGYDHHTRQAWSVIVDGRAREVTQPEDWDDLQGLPLFPWHVAPKPIFVRVVSTTISGRRFVAVYAGAGDDSPPTRS